MRVKNVSGKVVKELKPGIGTFEFEPGEIIEVKDEKVARSLVEDSRTITGTAVLEIVK